MDRQFNRQKTIKAIEDLPLRSRKERQSLSNHKNRRRRIDEIFVNE